MRKIFLLCFLSLGLSWPAAARVPTTMIGGGSGAAVDLTTNLELYLPLDGDLLDDSVNGNDAAKFGVGGASYVSGPAGGAGQAIDLDGSDDCIGDTATSFDALGIRTISVFVKFDTINATNRVFASGTDHWRVDARSTTDDFRTTRANGSGFADTADSIITTATWYHLILESPADGNDVAVDLDDVSQSMDDTTTATPTTGTSNYFAGGSGTGCSSPVDGQLCGLRIYSALLSDEVKTALFARKCP